MSPILRPTERGSVSKRFFTALLAVGVSVGCVGFYVSHAASTGQADPSRPSAVTRADALPTCTGVSDCVAGPNLCTGEDDLATVAPTVITDHSAGVSSDGRGPYFQRTDGVVYSVLLFVSTLRLDKYKANIRNPRKYVVNLDNPVPGGGGVPVGTITDGDDINIETQWRKVGNARQNLHSIGIGQTVTANQIDVSFHINGRFHVLQMGPQAYGHCHAVRTLVNGAGTSAGTIFRASESRWVIDVPAGSVGRLFDLHNTTQYAVDKGLYFTQLHYEIGK